MTPDQIDSVIVGVASLTVAGLSFIYASKAQRATRLAEAARERGTEIAVDAEAYRRARDLYESGIKQLHEQNDSLRSQLADFQAANDRLTRDSRELDARVASLERALRAAGIEVPPWGSHEQPGRRHRAGPGKEGERA